MKDIHEISTHTTHFSANELVHMTVLLAQPYGERSGRLYPLKVTNEETFLLWVLVPGVNARESGDHSPWLLDEQAPAATDVCCGRAGGRLRDVLGEGTCAGYGACDARRVPPSATSSQKAQSEDIVLNGKHYLHLCPNLLSKK